MNVTRDNRTLRFTDVPPYTGTTKNGSDYAVNCDSLDVTIGCAGENNVLRAVALDNVVLPHIVDALRRVTPESNDLICAAIAVAARFDSGGFENATTADRAVLDGLRNAYRAFAGHPPVPAPPAHTPGRPWTLAEIRQANADAGQYFFAPKTMKAHGDTMRSWKVRHRNGRVFLERVLPSRDSTGRAMGGVGEVREFNPSNGHIGVPMRTYPEDKQETAL